MILAPPLWATGAWTNNVWANGTWATSVTVVTEFGDLTTLFCQYMADIRRDHPTRGDTETLIAGEYATVRSTMHSPDDLNTSYAEFLSN